METCVSNEMLFPMRVQLLTVPDAAVSTANVFSTLESKEKANFVELLNIVHHYKPLEPLLYPDRSEVA